MPSYVPCDSCWSTAKFVSLLICAKETCTCGGWRDYVDDSEVDEDADGARLDDGAP